MSSSHHAPGTSGSGHERALKIASMVIALIVACGAFYVLFESHQSIKSDDLGRALRSIPDGGLLVSVGATLLSFLSLALMEYLGARKMIDPNLSFRKAGFFSLIVYGISNTFGLAGLASTPLRLRLYGTRETTGEKILSLCLLASAAFWLGLFALLGGCLIVASFLPGPGLRGSAQALFAGGVGFLCFAVVGGWLISGRKLNVFKRLSLELPGPSTLALQSMIGAVDWLLAGVALYALLPEATEAGFVRFMAGFLLSQIAALLSSIPGGLGVLEGFTLYFINASKESLPQFAAAYVAYRGIYYLAPLLCSLALFAFWNLRRIERQQSPIVRSTSAVAAYATGWVPLVATLLTSFIGVALLVESGRTARLMPVLPEFPAFCASLLGTGLIILATGIYERSSSARRLTLVIMAFLLAGTIVYGGTARSIVAIAANAALLGFSGRQFYRRTRLSSVRLHSRSAILILMPVLGSLTLAVVSFYLTEMGTQQWWKFALNSEESGFLRGTVGSLVTLSAFAIWTLFAPRGQPARDQNGGDTEAAAANAPDAPSVLDSPFTTSWLAFVGDKDIFRAEGVSGFIMYRISGVYWISMGDPVAPNAGEAAKLTTAFIENCDKVGGVPIFYQTRPETVASYVEVGFQAIKIGEEARVELAAFSLEGRERKTMRNTCSRIEREGFTFEILPKTELEPVMKDLERVSTEWLRTLSMREKSFSLGSFSQAYISRCDVATVSKGSELVAFANIWVTKDKNEFSVDLMRYSAAAPSGTMEYLIIQLMLHAKTEGYRWFNLGMAPLSGLESHAQAHRWHKVGTMLYNVGEPFYNFRGLKAFKDKFGPNWESRFLVYPPGSNLTFVLSNIALVIGAKQVKRRFDKAA